LSHLYDVITSFRGDGYIDKSQIGDGQIMVKLQVVDSTTGEDDVAGGRMALRAGRNVLQRSA
jgi:hypothetical protein